MEQYFDFSLIFIRFVASTKLSLVIIRCSTGFAKRKKGLTGKRGPTLATLAHTGSQKIMYPCSLLVQLEFKPRRFLRAIFNHY